MRKLTDRGKILVIDDDAHFALALSVRLRSAGFETCASSDAGSASSVVLRERPDLILLDVDMPRFSGFEFHECLRFSERGRGIPVVYLSGDDSAPNRLRAQQHGARAFVCKPYEAEHLVAVIDRVLCAAGRSAGPRTCAAALSSS